MSTQAAARVDDPFGHTAALEGALIGLAVGVAAGVFIVATAGTGALLVAAVGAAVATAGGAGLMGEAIGQTIHGDPSGTLKAGSRNVRVNARFATMVARGVGDCSHHGQTKSVATGVPTVRVNGLPIARVGEKMECSALILSGSRNVVITGESRQFLPMTPEVPALLNGVMLAAVVGGTLVATGGMAAAYGLPAAVGALVAGSAGGYAGGKLARAGAAAMGANETWQTVAEDAGGLVGGALSGAGGWRAGNALATEAALARMPPDFQAEYAAAKAAGWVKPDGSTWWPPNDGAVGTPQPVDIPAQTPLTRYGNEQGSFMSGNDPFYSRAMTGARPGEPNAYTTLQSTPAEQAQIAPWFDRPGGGTQYKLVDPSGSGDKYSVGSAIDDGYLGRGH